MKMKSVLKYIIFLIFTLIFVSCSDNGSESNTDTDYCKDVQCGVNSTCVELDKKGECKCDDNYIFSPSENKCIINEVDLCENLQCKINEECKIIDEKAECVCKSGYILDAGNCIEKEKTLKEVKIRVMAANLTTSTYQDYEFYGTSIMHAMKADIILVQEFNYDLDFNNSTSDAEVEAMIIEIYGVNNGYHFYRGKEIVVEDGDTPIPNGIISKYPILKKGVWIDEKVPNRDFNYAKIDIPGDKDLWVVSLHLKAGSSDDGVRNLQTKELMKKIKSEIPDGDYIVIGGDLNTSDRDERCIDNLNDIFKTEGPHPVCEAGKEGTNRSRRNPYDWVIASKSLASLQVSTDFCYDDILANCKRYPDGLVFDSKKYDEYDLEVYFEPVELDDSRGGEMQHMGVIKDFLIEYME